MTSPDALVMTPRVFDELGWMRILSPDRAPLLTSPPVVLPPPPPSLPPDRCTSL